MKCRAGAPSQRTSQESEMLRLEEPSIVQSLKETQLAVIVKLNILSRKIRQFSGGQLVLHLIQNLKVRNMYNNNQGRQNLRPRGIHINVSQDLGEER